jgi:regulator of protease activity HflC (stomatin/prohibitin superfamily)
MHAQRIVQDIISDYNFDELYGPDIPDGPAPRQAIAQRYQQRLSEELKPLGIRWAGGGISDVEPVNPEVYIRRVKNWQAEWERKITIQKAEGQAEWLRMVERARAEAQADLILKLGRQLEELSVARAEFPAESAMRLLVTVVDELMARQPKPTAEKTRETFDMLVGIRKALEG